MAGMCGLVLGFLLLFACVLQVSCAPEPAGSFTVFGHVDVQLKNYSRTVCPLHVSVQLADRVWKRQLESEFYVFKIPLQAFLGIPGLVDIDVTTEQQAFNIWRRVFVVDGSGGYHADAILTQPLSLNCLESTDEKQGDGLLLPLVPYTKPETCLPLNYETCPILHTSGAELASYQPDYTSSEYEGDENPSCCTVFGQCITPWHLATLAIIAVATHFYILLLKSFISSKAGFEHAIATTFELWTQPQTHSEQSAVSETVFFNRSWSDAPEDETTHFCTGDDSCLCENCGGFLRGKSGGWNRDNLGRLTRG